MPTDLPRLTHHDTNEDVTSGQGAAAARIGPVNPVTLSIPASLPTHAHSWLPFLLRRERWVTASQSPIAATTEQGLVVDASGRTFSCGMESVSCANTRPPYKVNHPGVLGHGGSSRVYPIVRPTPIGALAGVRVRSVVLTGGGSSFAVTREGALYSWGCSSSGLLAQGDDQRRYVPTLVAAFAGQHVSSVAASS